jgi:hypothetical protein
MRNGNGNNTFTARSARNDDTKETAAAEAWIPNRTAARTKRKEILRRRENAERES